MVSTVQKFANSATAKVALAGAFAFGAAANVNAAEIKELGQIDLSRPIPAGTCVADSPSGTAHSKLQAIKQARGQYNVIEADGVYVKSTQGNGLAAINFTSTTKPLPDKKTILGEGYVITSNKPKGQNGTQYCVHLGLDTTIVTNAISGSKVPNTVNIGDLGVALTNAMNTANSKVAFVAVTNQRTLLAVNFNYNTKNGGYILADGAGGTILPLSLVNVEYSMDLPLPIQRWLGIPPEKLALAEARP